LSQKLCINELSFEYIIIFFTFTDLRGPQNFVLRAAGCTRLH